MSVYKLYEGEYHFTEIVWENEPIKSSVLAKICLEKLGWKKSTTYTVLKKLIDKGILQNENTIVTSLVSRESIQQYESQSIVDKLFGGSLPKFITSFTEKQALSKEEIEEIQRIISKMSEDD